MSELKEHKFCESDEFFRENPGPLSNETHLYYLKSEADKVIAELKDKCQMHDFFWEGCGFAKRGFRNTIAVSEAFDELETENAKLNEQIEVLKHQACKMNCMTAKLYNEVCDDNNHQKYKRCLAMASTCRLRARWFGDNAFYKKEQWALQWHKRWLELAKQFKPNNSTAQ